MSVPVPGLLTQHGGDGLFSPDSDAWQLDERLDRAPEDACVRKTATDAFHRTDLHAPLQSYGVDHLVIRGLQSEFCVDSTTRGALALGYPVELVSDGHSTVDNGVLTAAQISAHHNATLASLDSYAPASHFAPQPKCVSNPEPMR